ncbi:hypothetical protein SO802_029899 [Lithocarpus litseifolius]|uniref:RNase H type-1 domain-containing protein n=1 Tax=Lithocarpus litseifolius TaxID=425828 RepID=A0AAW2BUE5_9ROSI
MHVMWACKDLDVVWEDSNQWGFRRSTSFLSFKELLSWILKNHQQPGLFAITGWAIWNQRNQVRTHQPSCSPHLIAASAKDQLAEFSSVQPAHNAPPRMQVRWQPPPQGTIKINFDGATSAKDQALGIGVVLLDENGSVLGSLAQPTTPLHSSNY